MASRALRLGITEAAARGQWPGLHYDNHIITSYAHRDQNCVPHALGEKEQWWWPGTERYHYWPSDIERAETLSAFEAAIGTKGYLRCDSPDLEEGYEKVAVYALGQIPQHVALQLQSGTWSSKLGELIDIEHAELHDLAGPCYGLPVLFMRRRRAQ